MENEEETKEIKYIDLFGGVGGFRLGIERATNLPKTSRSKQRGNEKDSSNSEQVALASKQFTCVFYNDFDKYAVQIYNKNFNESYEATDIRTVKADSIPDFDMLCGGFPCQAFSIAGKRKGFEDTRGTLFFEIARIIKAKKPKIVFLENVKGLLNHDKGQTFSVIIQTLSELGYDVQWMVLNSKFFGVPQNRERVFIIGSLREEHKSEILPFRFSSSEFGQNNECNEKTAVYFDDSIPKAKTRRGRVMDISGANMAVPRGGVAVLDDYNHRIKSDNIVGAVRQTFNNPHEGNGCKIIEGMKIRRFTPIECERLQGFPDNWTEGISESQRYKQMGNAVTVNVIEAIVRRLKNNDK